MTSIKQLLPNAVVEITTDLKTDDSCFFLSLVSINYL